MSLIKAKSTKVRASLDVFIAHRSISPDRNVARVLREELNSRNIRNFFDEEDFHAGDSIERKIESNILRARLVVVFFSKDPSSWVDFEAACALYDGKLVPVSINDYPIPPPYNELHFEKVNANDEQVDQEALKRVADQIAARLFGKSSDIRTTNIYTKINNFFGSGYQILSILLFPFIVLGFPHGSQHQHVNQLHASLGAAVLGGQFFLFLAFAKIVASPSNRERRSGLKRAEELLTFWALLAVTQLALGLWLSFLYSLQKSTIEPWIWLSFVLYLLGFLFTAGGYIAAKRAQEFEDAEDKSLRHIAACNLIANLLFLVGFVFTVGVMNVMVLKPSL
jgi:hypothetical protein